MIIIRIINPTIIATEVSEEVSEPDDSLIFDRLEDKLGEGDGVGVDSLEVGVFFSVSVFT